MASTVRGSRPDHAHAVPLAKEDGTSATNHQQRMEHKVILHIEKLPEGVYLATSDSVQGLVAQGRTIAETLEIARDVAKKPLEAQAPGSLPQTVEFGDRFEYPLVVGL
jgi:predicted RNase H-like HicB family nuclease